MIPKMFGKQNPSDRLFFNLGNTVSSEALILILNYGVIPWKSVISFTNIDCLKNNRFLGCIAWG